MAMDWRDVAKVVAPLAPTLGGILGGFIPFPGGGLAGQALGNLIAKQFGVEPTPDAVGQAVLSANNEVAIAKLRAAADEARAQWPAMAEIEKALARLAEVQIGQVNTTMRAELASESLFKSGWRPATGWVLCFLIAAVGTMTIVALLLASFGNPTMLQVLTAAWPLVLAVLGVPAAVVGVAVFSRGQEKIAAIGMGVATPVPDKTAPSARVPARK